MFYVPWAATCVDPVTGLVVTSATVIAHYWIKRRLVQRAKREISTAALEMVGMFFRSPSRSTPPRSPQGASSGPSKLL